MIVKIGVQSSNQPEQNLRRQAKSSEMSGLGENDVVPKRILRPRGKKAVDMKIEVESLNCKRNLRSSKKEVKEYVAVVIEPKKTRRGRKKLPEKPLEDPGLEEDKDVEEDVQIDEEKEAAADQQLIDPLENVEISSLGENVDTKNGSDQDHVAEKEVVVGGSSINGSSEADNKQDDHEVVKEAGPDSSRWSDLEKMTLGDFFDYLEVQLPKEIYEKSEKIIADLEEKARKCNELRLKRN